MKAATKKQELPSEAPVGNNGNYQPNTEQLDNNSNGQTIETEQIPDAGLCLWQEPEKTGSPQENKLAKTEVVLISDIQFDETQADRELVRSLKSTILAPWGQLLTPVLVSRLPQDKHGKTWLLRRGINRLVMAKELEWQQITVSIVEGSETEIQLLVKESKMVRRKLNAYQEMQNVFEWISLIQAAHHEYKPGGDKAKKALTAMQQSLPSLEALIEKHTGLKKSAFYAKYRTFNNLQPEVKALLEKHPKLAIARHERRLARLSKYTAKEQKEMVPYLDKSSEPEDAYFQCEREKAAAKGSVLPENAQFPVYHEDFVANADRIPDGTVDLILIDPNWFLAENDRKGQFWKLGTLNVAPYLVQEDWEQFVQLAAKKLNPNGHMAVLIGQQCFFEMSDVIREYFDIRWVMAYVHGSGAGTAARAAYIASHWRPILLCRRKDAPPFTSEYTEYLHDLEPTKTLITLPGDTPEDLLGLLRAEKQLLDQRIHWLEATGNDPLSNDTFMSNLIAGCALKKFHPWQQDVNVFRNVMRSFTKPGGFVWDAFIGSGTTGIAAVSCWEWQLVGSKRKPVLAPRRGIGCDAMDLWANIAKFRIWEAQHGGPDSFDELEKAMSSGGQDVVGYKPGKAADGNHEQEQAA